MTEWWNKKYEFNLWRSMWLFLTEVEGLDDKRAKLYVDELLEKRYDTVDVLMLATKQDLVEDANISPGDALRIIAAALAVAARREGYRAETFQQEREQRGEGRSEFPRDQETKAAPETVAQGVGALTLPRRISAQPLNGPFYCGLCMVTCYTRTCLRIHFKGKKHAKWMMATGLWLAILSAGQSVIGPKAYHCCLCNITCSGTNDLIMHFKGCGHQILLEED